MASLNRQIADIQSQIDDLYNRPMALGTQKINSHLIKAKTITANDLDVSDLQSVSQNTGNLVITGSIAAGTGLSAMGWDPTNGIYLGNTNPALAPFSVSPAGALKGSAATITGNVTATTLAANGSGSIAGWTIDSSKLSQGNVGIGNSSGYRIWSGLLASPSLANFSVDNSGNIKAAAGSIAGFTVDSAKFATDSGNTGFGQSGGQRIWAGGSPASAPFRVDSTGAMVSTGATISGAVTATSGSFTGTISTANLTATGGSLGGLSITGTLTVSGGAINVSSGSINVSGGNVNVTNGNVAISSSGKLTWNSGSSYISTNLVHFEAPLSQSTVIDFSRAGYSPTSSIQSFVSSGSSLIYLKSSSASGDAYLSIDSETTPFVNAHLGAGLQTVGAQSSAGVVVGLGDSAGTYQFQVKAFGGSIVFGAGSNGDLIRQVVNDATALGAYYGRVPIYINGVKKYLGVYS